jgi:hypothetical protein
VKDGILPDRPKGFTDDQWALVVGMCALNPADRLSMDEVVDQLRKFAEDEFNSVHIPPTLAISSISSIPSLDNGIARELTPALCPASTDSTPADMDSGTEGLSPECSSECSSECKQPPPISDMPESIPESDSTAAEQPADTPPVTDPPLTALPHAEVHTPSPQDDTTSLQDPPLGNSAIPALDTTIKLGVNASVVPNSPAHVTNDVAMTLNPPSPSPSPSSDVVVSVSISDHRTKLENGKRIVQYEVCVELACGEPITVWKRYSDFRHLSQHFSREYATHMEEFHPFPSRKPFSRTTSDRVINQRKLGLDAFLNAILNNNHLPLGIDAGNQRTVRKSIGSSSVVL